MLLVRDGVEILIDGQGNNPVSGWAFQCSKSGNFFPTCTFYLHLPATKPKSAHRHIQNLSQPFENPEM